MLLLFIILLIRLLSANLISKYCNRDQVLNYTWCDGGETILVARGSWYLEKECDFYFIPYENLNATLCPLSILNMTSDDNKCYRLFYPNGTFRTLNIQMEEAPSILKINTETMITPFNGEVVLLYCPLYGFPSLEITWSIPFNYTERFDVLSHSRINNPKSTQDGGDDDKALDSILGNIHTGDEDDICDLYLEIFYKWFVRLEGDYYCTGRNKFGNRTVFVANINNGSLCLSSENSDYLRFENLLIELQPVYKVSEDKIGGNVTIICKLLPYTRNVRVGWMKTEHMGSRIDICPGANATHGLLRNDDKYTVREWSESGKKEEGPKCTKVISLTIHAFKSSDRGEYSCVAQICSNNISSTKINSKSTRITGDNLNIKTDVWVFSLTALPVLTMLILLVVAGILIYAYRYRIIRWYIAWRREEPKGNFEFEIFICMAEEYDANLIADVKREIVDKAISSDSSVLWSENEDCNIIGLNHYVNAVMLLEKCRKFIFVVNDNFGHCFFCRQMVELATEKSSGKNWNIILPIKWTADAIVPVELMRYRYIERETSSDYFHKIENFLTGRSESDRNRTRRDYQMVELNPLAFVNEDDADD